MDQPRKTFINDHWSSVIIFQWCCLASLFFWYYAPAIGALISDWRQSSTFSYAFLVPPVTVFLVQQRWGNLKLNPVLPSFWASIPLTIALLLAVGGNAMGDSFSVRISLILALGSLIWLMFGTRIFKSLLFPLFYLCLMIPVPYVLIKDVTFYLRYSDAQHAANLVQLLGIPVYRESYFLHIPNMTLEVADVCSGVSSVFALFASGVVYAHFLPIRASLKFLLAVLTFPFAVMANLFRIILTVVLAYNFGSVVFQSYFHGFSGMFTFVLALMMVIGVGEALKKRFPVSPRTVSFPDEAVLVSQNRVNWKNWGSFAFGTIIFLAALYFPAQVGAGRAIRPMIDLRGLELGNGYKNAGAKLEDGYKDDNADTSLSRVFIGGDGKAIDVFVGYRAQQKGGIRLRSPKLYFPDKWNSAWLKPAALRIVGATSVNGNWMLVRKGDSAEAVLYWYQIASRTYAGELEYRIEQLRRTLIEGRSDGAVIRISTPVRNGEALELAQARLRKAGVHLYDRLARVLSP